MTARIFRPSRTAMQSGRAKTKHWHLEFEPELARHVDSLMGWTSSADMKQQISMTFDSREAAVAFCERHGIPYRVVEPHERRPRRRAYADNFRYDAVE